VSEGFQVVQIDIDPLSHII